MRIVSEEISIYRVTRTGSVERLGSWNHDARLLTLERDGYPLLRTGTHQMEGDLPWLFWDMCPSGFLGARLAQRWPAAALPSDPRLWNRDEVLRALTHAGGELSGSLLIGDEAKSQFESWSWPRASLHVEMRAVLSASTTTQVPSSLGGERPKFNFQAQDGLEALVKFSPAPGSVLAQRWADLLRIEAHCSETILANGILAARCTVQHVDERVALIVTRFDRRWNRGRVGTSTLYWLAMDRWGDVNIPAPEVTRRLVESGDLPAEDAVTCAKVHAFSAAIGNNDAHLGNYGLVFDDEGRARLAPIYDVLPMVFAPRNDELPDEWVKPRAAKPSPEIQKMVEHLAGLIEQDTNISREFKDLWLRYVDF